MKKFTQISGKVRLIILGAVLITGWLVYKNFFQPKTTAVSYQTATVEKGTLITTLTAAGQIGSVNNRSVTTSASGVVLKVNVKNGQEVKVGTAIASVDLDMEGRQSRDAAYTSYLSAKNSLETTKNSLLSLQSALAVAYDKFHNDAGARGLATDDVTYVQQYNAYQTAQFNVNNFDNQLKLAERQVATAWANYQKVSSTIYAPISGTISGLSIAPGMVIGGGSSEAKVANITTMSTPTVTVNLTEVDIPKVEIGDKATITLDALTDKTYTGKVLSIDKSGSVSSGVVNYPVTIQLDTTDDLIYPNMSATTNIITSVKNDVVLVASTAIKKSNDVSTVQIMKEGQPISVEVEVGESNGTQTEIVSGVNEGDVVVTSTVSTTKSSASSTTSVFSSSNRSRTGGNVMMRGF